MASECQEIGFLPPRLLVTYAKDYYQEKSDPQRPVDVHMFNQFFTFQVNQPTTLSGGAGQESSAEMHFNLGKSMAKEGFVLRLRSELSVGSGNQVQQGMRVTVLEQKSGDIIVDGTTLDYGDQGYVLLEIDTLKEDTDYVLRYDLYDTQILSSKALGDQGAAIRSMTNVRCKHPFITQELMIIDKRLLKLRIAHAEQATEKGKDFTVSGFTSCDFKSLNNTYNSAYFEESLYCSQSFYLPTSSQTSSAVSVSTKTDDEQEFRYIGNGMYEQKFSIRGPSDKLVTYLFTMNINYNFMVNAGLKVYLARDEEGSAWQQMTFSELCLLDRSCVVSMLSEKSQMKLEAILTTGNYKLVLMDKEDEAMRRLLRDESGLTKKPFDLKVQAYPVTQNEDRVNCGYMYLDEEFIQRRFIEGKRGERFVFSDNVIMNVFNLTQNVNLRPEVDSILKIRIKEAFGVNTQMVLCSGDDCLQQSTQVGTSEVLFAYLKAGTAYYVELGFAHSIIVTESFLICPHLPIELSLISVADATQLMSDVETQIGSQAKTFENKQQKLAASGSQTKYEISFESVEKLNQIFNKIESVESLKVADYQTVYYVIPDDTTTSTYSTLLTSNVFTANFRRQMLVEVFYEPYLYDIEVAIFSEDVTRVRSHLYGELAKAPHLELSLYKGSKQLFVELEPGSYTIKFTLKTMPIMDEMLDKFQVSMARFQMRLLYDEYIEKHQVFMPETLNYYGLLGPTGSNYGQLTYLCEDCILDNSLYTTTEIQSSSKGTLLAMLYSEAGYETSAKAIDVNFELVGSPASESGKQNSLREFKMKRGMQIGTKQTLDSGLTVIEAQVQPNTKYRLVIMNKSPSGQTSEKFTLRVELSSSEQQYQMLGKSELDKLKQKNQQSLLPQTLDEIMRYKIKTEGVKESGYLLASKMMLEWVDKESLSPFLMKNPQIYSFSNYLDQNGRPQELRLPITISEPSAMVFAAFQTLTHHRGLEMEIINTYTKREIMSSVPHKYHAQIGPVTLTKGYYELVVRPASYITDEDFAMLGQTRFTIDFLYERRENSSDIEDMFMHSYLELCPFPSFPNTFNSPSLMHPLNGDSLSKIFKIKLSEIMLDPSLYFTLEKPSLFIIDMELPKEVKAFIEISKLKGTTKIRVSTEELEVLKSKRETFTRAENGFEHLSIIQVREFLPEGEYSVKIHTQDEREKGARGMMRSLPQCSAALMQISVTPFQQSASIKQNEVCKATTTIGEQLQFGKHQQGSLVYSTTTDISDTTSIMLDTQGEGPFYFYFATQYDQQLEGQVGLILYQYDKDNLGFREVSSHLAQDSQSVIFAAVQEGIYVLSIFSISSTPLKYVKPQALIRQDPNMNFFQDSCVRLNYSYYVTSAQKMDSMSMNLMDFFNILFGMDQFSNSGITDNEIIDEMQDFISPSCAYDELPQAITGHIGQYKVQEYNLRLNHKQFEIIDVIVQEPSLFKIDFEVPNPKNNLNAFLYQDEILIAYTGTDGQMKGATNQENRELIAQLKSQRKPYKLKIVSDTLDEEDPCPSFTMRVAIASQTNLRDEALTSKSLGMPEEKYSIVKDEFDMEGSFQISYEMIQEYMLDDSEVTYDIILEQANPQDSYYFDIELKHDFLTSAIDFTLLTATRQNPTEADYFEIGSSYQVREEEQSGSKLVVKRLKLNEQMEEQKSVGTHILRLIFPREMLRIDQLTKYAGRQQDKPICFGFGLSIRASKSDDKGNDYSAETDPWKNELIRIDWPTNYEQEFFDSRDKLSVFLLFKDSMKEEYKTLKFQNFAYLLKEGLNPSTSSESKILPQSIRMSVIDKSTLVLSFQHNALEKGTCYRLYLDQDTLQVKMMDKTLMEQQTKICTSACLCNTKGMKGCDEDRGVCQCHFPYTGPECSQCEKGFVFDPTTQECQPLNRCLENGGEEDCNGHGVCTENQYGQAQCNCDIGFADDGLDFCGRCSDPMFEYPDCYTRNWIIEPSQFNCYSLPIKMPTYLYEPFNSNPQMNQNSTLKTYQNKEGFAHWNGVYRVSPKSFTAKEQQTQVSKHYFKAMSNSVLRLFVDTHETGVAVTFKLFDSSRTVLYSSLDSSEKTLVMSLPQSDEDYLLEFTYFFNDITNAINKVLSTDDCYIFEVFMIVQPQETMRSYLLCSAQELQDAAKKPQTHWTLGTYTEFFSQSFTLPSNNMSNAVGSENESIKIRLSVEESGNALSIIVGYIFEKVVIQMTLRDVKTGNVIKYEQISSLEDIESVNAEAQVISEQSDMISYIEIPSIQQGEYELEISFPRVLFMSGSFETQRKKPTCLSFDLSVEYLAKKQQQAMLNPSQTVYNVVSVIPKKSNNLTPSSKLKIELIMDKEIDVNELSESYSELHQIFYLASDGYTENKIELYPHKVLSEKEKLSLYFDFSQADMKKLNLTKLPCLTLKSDQNPSALTQIAPFQQNTRYCFSTEMPCNPNALPKLDNSGSQPQCICSYPYTGPYCEKCEPGYLSVEAANNHTLCELDLSKCSGAICNNHGQCQADNTFSSKDKSLISYKCKCDPKYDGRYCERCANSDFMYPDCEEKKSTSDVILYQGNHLKRSKYNENGYESNLAEEAEISDGYSWVKKPQCLFTSYPKDLNKVEFLDGLGEIHIADFFTVNHDQDNIIKFTPQTQGMIKILLQQPELEELMINEESFDLEIGLLDPETNKYLQTSMNSHLGISTGRLSSKDGKLNYAYLQTVIPYDKVGKTLHIVFRAVNFTMTSDSLTSSATGCETLYMEIEYKGDIKERQCQYNPKMNQGSAVTVLTPDQTYTNAYDHSRLSAYSVYSTPQTFFYYEDFYISPNPNYGDQGTMRDFEIKISLQQKFMERNMIGFMVEMLEEEVNYEDIQVSKHSSDQPKCDLVCLMNGQKSYNEIHNVIEVSPRTLVRVWLYQSNPDYCANFQLFITAGVMDVKDLDHTTCKEPDLPTSFNTDRYLGAIESVAQQDFHFLETFRIDSALSQNSNSSGHMIYFELKEPSLVRVVGIVHRHIEFDLEIGYVSQNTKLSTWKDHDENCAFMDHHKLVESGAKGFEDSIFTQLAPGKYYLRLSFLAEAFFMRQPCQSVQLEVAISTINSAKEFLTNQQRTQAQGYSQGVDFSSLLKGYTASPLTQSRTLAQIGKSNPDTLYHSQLVMMPSMIRAYDMADQSQINTYRSYVELYSERFRLGQQSDTNLKTIGLLISTQSDFITNDISFALTHVPTGTILKSPRQSGMVRLYLENMLGGEYELVIYAHNCLSNMNSDMSLNYIDVRAKVEIQVVGTQLKNDFTNHYVTLEAGKAGSIQVPVKIIDQQNLKCLRDFPSLDELVINDDFGMEVMKSAIDTQKTFQFVASKDSVRISMALANSQITLQSVESQAVIEKSISLDNDQRQVLYASGLVPGKTYKVTLHFPQNNFECETFLLSIHFSNSSLHCPQEGRLQASTFQSLYGNPQIVLNTVATSPVNEQSMTYLMAQGQTRALISVVVERDMSEVIFSLDASHTFYMGSIALNRMTNGAGSVRKDIEKQVKMRVIEGIKETAYVVRDLVEGRYTMVVDMRKKPEDCEEKLVLRIRTEQKVNAEESAFTQLMTTSYNPIRHSYQSQMEINELNRYVEKLPINMNTYKYLRDEEYMFISEYVRLTPHDDAHNTNVFSFRLTSPNGQNQNGNQKTNNQSLVKFYLESDGVVMTLRQKGVDRPIVEHKSQSLVKLLPNDQDYELTLEYTTKGIILAKDAVHITILIAQQSVYTQLYTTTQGSSLLGCERNLNFPLALARTPELQYSKHDIVYVDDYMRLAPSVLQTKYVVESYNFRVNETSIMFFQIGMHMLRSQLTLRLTDFGGKGAQTHYGKQEFNLNVLHLLVGPGDYSLIIEQPSLLSEKETLGHNDCGIYSLFGRITPLSDIEAQSLTGVGALSSQCEVRQTLPSKIYKNEAEIKDGHEMFVNRDGTFSRAFDGILIKPQQFDVVALTSPEDGLLTVMIQTASPSSSLLDLISVKVYDEGTESEQTPIYKRFDDSTENVQEMQISFKVLKNRQYALVMLYTGTQTFDNQMREMCNYYNAFISIDTFKRLSDELKCLPVSNELTSTKVKEQGGITLKGSQDKKLLRMEDIPGQINQSGKYNWVAEMKYPESYGDASNDLMMKTIEIKTSQEFKIESFMKFDFPYSLFSMHLFSYQTDSKNPKPEDFELIASQQPLTKDQNDAFSPTLVRQLVTENALQSQHSYFLTMSDDVSQPLLKFLAKELNQPLCLYAEVSIDIIPQTQNKVLATTPYISKVQTIGDRLQTQIPLVMKPDTMEIKVSVEFSQPLDPNNAKQLIALAFKLQFLNPALSQQLLLAGGAIPEIEPRMIEYQKMPTSVTVSSTYTQALLVFDISAEQKNLPPTLLMRLAYSGQADNQPKLRSEKGETFDLGKEIKMPWIMITRDEGEQKRKEESHQSVIQQEVREIEKDKKEEEVKCLCVHGTCNKGEWKCNKCEPGWHGQMCDIKQNDSNINKGRATQKFDGSRMERDRSQRDADESKQDTSQKTVTVDIERTRMTKDQDQSTKDSYIDQESATIMSKSKSTWQHQQTTLPQTQDSQPGFLGRLVLEIESLIYALSILLLALVAVGALAYIAYILCLRKNSRFQSYMPVNMSEEDRDEHQPQTLELTEFRPVRRDQSITRRDDFPSQSIAMPNPQNQRQEQSKRNQNQDLFEDDLETKKLSHELELYQDSDEDNEQTTLKSQSRPKSQQQESQDQHNSNHSQENLYHNEQDQAYPPEQQTYFDQHQSWEQNWDQQFNTYGESQQPQHETHVQQTSNEIDQVLQSMGEDHEDEGDEQERLFHELNQKGMFF